MSNASTRSLLDYVPRSHLSLYKPESQDPPAEGEEPSDSIACPPVARQTPPQAGPGSKLRQCYQAVILPELEITDTTAELNESLLTLWEKFTENPPVQSIEYQLVKAFRKSLIDKKYRRGKALKSRSTQTVNRHMRHFYAMISPLWPADRHNPGGRGWVNFFKKLKPLARQKKLPFTYGRTDLSSLYVHATACRPEKIFRPSHLHNAALWQCAFAVAQNAGPRAWDLFAMTWMDFLPDDFKHGAIWFQAIKNKKVSRIPLNWVARSHLDYVRSLNLDPVRVFPGFEKNKSFYSTWKRICAAAGVAGPFEAFRKTCSTMHNNVVPGAGAWITAHSLKGVDAEYYDDPTERIFKAIYGMKLPREFKRGALALPTSRKSQSS